MPGLNCSRMTSSISCPFAATWRTVNMQHENTQPGEGISWFDEDKWTLQKRVEQIQTGVHYAEEPLSRVSHMVTNIRVVDVQPSADNAQHVTTHSRFLVYQNRVEYETNLFAGRRIDTLRRRGKSWEVTRREILLDQNVLLAKNLSTFLMFPNSTSASQRCRSTLRGLVLK